MSQKQQHTKAKSKKGDAVNRNYLLRNSVRWFRQGNNLEILDKLLCKPVSVKVVKLPKAQGRETQCKTPGGSRITKRRKGTPSARRTLRSTRRSPNELKIDINSLTKPENQPFIKLDRIDEVIHKLAQSLTKVSRKALGQKRIQEKSTDGTTQTEENRICQEKPVDGVTETYEKEIRREEVLDSSTEKRACQESLGTIIETQTSAKEPTGESLNAGDRNEKPESDNESDTICSFRKRNKDGSSDRRRVKRMRLNSDTTDELDPGTVETSPPNESLNTSDLFIDNSNSSNETFILKRETRGNKELQSNGDLSDGLSLDLDDSRDTVLLGVKEESELNIVSNLNEVSSYDVYNTPQDLKVLLIRFDRLRDFGIKYSAREVEEAIREYANANSSSIPCTVKTEFKRDEVSTYIPTFSPESSPRISSFSSDEKVKSAERACRTPVEETSIQSRSSSYKSAEFRRGVCNLAAVFEKEKHRSSDQHSFATDTILSSTPKTSLPRRVEETTPKKSAVPERQDLQASKTCEKREASDARTARRISIQDTGEQEAISFKASQPGNLGSPANSNYNSDHVNSSIKKKPVQEKVSILSYRCIVCDITFTDFAILQKHLAVHSNKNSITTADSLDDLDIPEERPLVIDLRERGELPKSKSKKSKRDRKHENVPKKAKAIISKEKKKKSPEPIEEVYETCDVCSRVFHNSADRAAHIFLHSERETRDALERANKKCAANRSPKSRKDKKNRRPSAMSPSRKTSPEKKEELNMMTVDETEQSEDTKEGVSPSLPESNGKILEIYFTDPAEEELIMKKTTITFPKLTELLTPNQTETTAVGQSSKANSESVQGSNEKPDGTETSDDVGRPSPVQLKGPVSLSTKKKFTVCDCHNQSRSDDASLRIEIVLLCHVCRTLFRTMHCFNKHYEHRAVCEAISDRSPFLFCSTCGMILNSIPNMRHHLEMHARFSKTACNANFRCSICKVTFFGIGPFFYTHWASHAKNPRWVANEHSFPDESILSLPSFKNLLVDGYITVAQYRCSFCKEAFPNSVQLDKHLKDCDKVVNTRIGIVCGLCDVAYTDKSEYFKHVKAKHNFCGEPQLTDNGSTIVCEVCKEISMDVSEFDNHWLKHLTTQTTFTCTDCQAEFQDNLNLFYEHAKLHRVEELFCIVHYANRDHICHTCEIGFDSLEKLNEHVAGHRRANENDRATPCIDISKENSPVRKGVTSNFCNVAQDSSGEKNDREKSLENTEVIIDLTKEDKGKEENAAPGPAAQEPPRDVVREDRPLEKEEPKPRQGFLRVKTLKELTGIAYICKACGCSFETANELTEHEVDHEERSKAKTIVSQEGLKLKLVAKQGVCKVVPLRVEVPDGQTSQPARQAATDSTVISLSDRPTNVNEEQQASSSNSSIGYHKNLPQTSLPHITYRSKAVPRAAILKSNGTPYTIKLPSGLSPAERKRLSSSFVYMMDPKDNRYKFKCRFCDFHSSNESDCVTHDNPGSEASCKFKYARNQNRDQGSVAADCNKPPQPSQSQGKAVPFVNACLGAGGSSEVLRQNYQVPGQPTDPIYYKTLNNTGGGMSIVINQPAANVQTVPTFGMLPLQQQLYQQQVHPNPMTIIGSPYVQQSQNVVICSNNVCQVRRDQISNGEAVTTCEFRLQPTRFVCSHCSRSFATENLLQAHVSSDHDFTCTVCNQRFYRANELLVHKLKHRDTN